MHIHCSAMYSYTFCNFIFHVSHDPCFSGSRFFRVQVLKVALKLIVALNLTFLCHIYVYNFFLFKSQCQNQNKEPRIRQLVKVTISEYLDFHTHWCHLWKKKFFWKILFHTEFIACWSCAGTQPFVAKLFSGWNLKVIFQWSLDLLINICLF